MYTCYPQVEQLVVVLVEVKMPFGVEDVELGTEHELDAFDLSGDDVKVAEIQRVARPRYTWGMLRDAEYVQAYVGGLVYHLMQGAEGVSADDGMGVDIKSWVYHASAFGAGISWVSAVSPSVCVV